MSNFGMHDLVTLQNMDNHDVELNGERAIITDVHGTSTADKAQFGVYVENIGPVYWVNESQMELIERNREDLLGEWEEDDEFEDDEDDDDEFE